MTRKSLISSIITYLMLIAIVSFLLVGCGLPGQTVTDFDFIFRYGITAKNELNTFEDTYTKDMILEPSITVNMSLTAEEKAEIYQKMVEIDFWSYPDRFSVKVKPGEIVSSVTPYPSYYFKVTRDSEIKELWWDDNIGNPDGRASKLRELIQLIENIIRSKDEYKNLPEPKGGYM